MVLAVPATGQGGEQKQLRGATPCCFGALIPSLKVPDFTNAQLCLSVKIRGKLFKESRDWRGLDSRTVVSTRVALNRENQAGGAPSRVNSAINWYKSWRLLSATMNSIPKPRSPLFFE